MTPMPPPPVPIHQLLLVSGLEFIEQAVADFQDEKYKFSVIHFSSGIEVIMKARICQQDFRLAVVKKHRDRTEAEFRNGDCYTIGPEQCMKVLTGELGVSLPGAGKNWSELAGFRNRAIHFVLASKLNDKLRLLHYKGFYDLKSFIRRQRLPFKPHRKRIQRLDNALGTLVKQRFAPHIDELYRLLEEKTARVRRQLELTIAARRSVAARYFSLENNRKKLQLTDVIGIRKRPPDNDYPHQHTYYQIGSRLKRITSTHDKRHATFTLIATHNPDDLDFIELQLAHHWPRLLYYGNGNIVPRLSISDVEQAELCWPSAEQRSLITQLLFSCDRRTAGLRRQLDLLANYYEGLRHRSFT